MRKRGNLVLLTLSLVLALITTLVIVRELKTRTTAPTIEKIPMEAVVVVKKDVPSHTLIDASDVSVEQLPTSAVEAGAAKQLSSVVGQYTATNWLQGQQVIAGMFESAKATAFSASIPTGEVAFTIPDNPVTGVDHLILPGDHIDILDYKSNSTVTMSNLLVLFVDQVQTAANPSSKPAAGSSADTLTVAVTPQQANQLAKLLASGSIHILLRNSSQP